MRNINRMKNFGAQNNEVPKKIIRISIQKCVDWPAFEYLNARNFDPALAEWLIGQVQRRSNKDVPAEPEQYEGEIREERKAKQRIEMRQPEQPKRDSDQEGVGIIALPVCCISED